MTNYPLILSSNNPAYVEILPLLNMDDHSTLIVDLTLINEDIPPTNIQFDWGDGNIENFDVNSIEPIGINIFKLSPLLKDGYIHIYYPSETALYKSLSAQILIHYCNGQYAWFIQPIKIRTFDYFESIGDMDLVNTTILPSNNTKEYQLLTHKNQYAIELTD